MRSTLILAAILIAGLTAYFVFFYSPNLDSLVPGDTAFAVKDTSEVYGIVLTQYREEEPGQQIRLERLADGDWQFNGAYPAMRPRVRNLLAVMSRIEVREVLNEAATANAQRFFSTVRTRVDLFDQDGDLMHSYDVGSETPGSRGTLMRMRHSETPYVVELPGLQGYVKAAYSLDPTFWRANRLFDASLSRLIRFSVLYREPERSFTLEKVNDSTFVLAGPGAGADPDRLADYLANFKGQVYGETFAEQMFPGKKEQLAGMDPDIRIVAAYRDGSQKSLVLYDREDDDNGLFGWIEGENELLTIQHFVIDPFLKTRSHILGDTTGQSLLLPMP